ncbi:hypothetical protein HYX08_03430 [Candidatus Woesearchaeota archaeon]|nr:hypothetical protein [Candidatus Woesearchaeota archaeon]
MYKAKLWDEDKWDIHSKGYSSTSAEGRKEDKKYHEQKYGSKDQDSSSDYMRKEESKEDEKEKKPGFLDELGEEKKEQKIEDEEIPFRAANQLFSEKRHEAKPEKRKDINSIEEAIKKAVEEEKKVIIMDS